MELVEKNMEHLMEQLGFSDGKATGNIGGSVDPEVPECSIFGVISYQRCKQDLKTWVFHSHGGTLIWMVYSGTYH